VKLRTFDSASALAEAAAQALGAFVQRMPQAVLGLPTGRTPVPIYARWQERQALVGSNLSGVRIFGLDELAVAPGQLGPFRRYLETHVGGPLGLRPEQLHTFPVGDEDPAGFDTELQAAGGMDLLVLGVGSNGHIAFNEPGVALHARAHRLALTPESRMASAWLFPGGLADVPHEAFTLGMGSLMQAREVWVLATGRAKASVLKRTLNGPLTPECPASFLQLHGACTVWADAEAAEPTSDAA
jgi:glucosamine-6-phosphate deaminase